ncbi:MAG: hypothetical protein DI626_11185 [Micavibrio aeruginosavorus]|uniref:Uncharacterized protein n=1 Tax=Micavibrio aeruginosavorus TaxID=349221 RepID=A0A2W5BHL2_9BACT|nr:MAG: hypothetical protein DI626_11185 [Micavibrio aeruginosavorus]
MPAGEGDPLRTITMVGARLSGRELSPADAGYLSKVFSICADRNIGVAPDVELRVANLEYGCDFLARPEKSDLVVLSYIFYEPSMIGLHRVQDYVRQSSLAANNDSWHNALLETGTKLAVNVIEGDGRCELPTSFIDRAPFRHTETIAAPDINKNFALLRR